MRRVLGRAGWPIVFFLVAGLVFAGLGWVTVSALRVERAQREAAAQAELGTRIRSALWRLDGRVLLTLGGEDSRPFYHYNSADPAGPYGPAATPLLTAALPDWMTLHFQLDPVLGWTSNQAPADLEEADRVRGAWSELPLRNFYSGREDVLTQLRTKFPAAMACAVFGERDRAIPEDSLPFAAPLFTEPNPAQQLTPPASGAPSPPANASGAANPNPGPTLPNPPVFSQPEPTAPKPPPIDNAVQAVLPKAEPFRLFGYELCPAPDPAQQQLPGNQLALNNSYSDNNNQKKNDGGRNSPRLAPPPNVVMRGGPRAGQKDQQGEDFVNRAQTFGKGLQEAKGAYDFPFPWNYGGNTVPLTNNGNARNAAGNTVNSGGAGNQLPAAPGAPGPPPGAGGQGGFGGLGAEVLKALRLQQEKQDAERGAGAAKKTPEASDDVRGEKAKSDADGKAADKAEAKPLAPPAASGVPVAPAVPGEDRPAPAAMPVPAPIDPVVPPGPPVVHLGSMRPQWITAPDGTELLVLVRTARFDGKTVYQGVVLDWAKLEAELIAQIPDLFPQARLVPVKDPEGVLPDRAMTALPVQLDPGPETPLPPPGWTPLRFGLVLAWAAAIIAVVAVGFSGWSLIDLAERRIRFVSAVTHELRTPLTSLRLYLDMLVSGMIQDEAKRQEYLNTLATESDRLHRLVDNVLDFARLEKRRKNGDVKPVKVCELVEQVRGTWTDRVAQDGKELVVISTLQPECEVDTDGAMIQQIVGNLIDNARKYTREADDRRIWLWAKPGPGKSVVLEVEDRGVGVPAGERKSIFKPFRRGECADSKAGGAGLGLALAKSWAEVLGAKLTYRPADGGTGACFRLELPGK